MGEVYYRSITSPREVSVKVEFVGGFASDGAKLDAQPAKPSRESKEVAPGVSSALHVPNEERIALIRIRDRLTAIGNAGCVRILVSCFHD